MKIKTEMTAIDLSRIDFEARKLRAKVFADAMKSLWAWAKEALHVGSGRTA